MVDKILQRPVQQGFHRLTQGKQADGTRYTARSEQRRHTAQAPPVHKKRPSLHKKRPWVHNKRPPPVQIKCYLSTKTVTGAKKKATGLQKSATASPKAVAFERGLWFEEPRVANTGHSVNTVSDVSFFSIGKIQ